MFHGPLQSYTNLSPHKPASILTCFLSKLYLTSAISAFACLGRGVNGLVFASRAPSEPILPVQVLMQPCPLAGKPDLSTLPTATQTFALTRARLAKLVQSDDAIRFEALRKIKVMTLDDPDASDPGRAVSAEAAFLSDDQAMFKSFNDTFAPKATSTLIKRAAELWRFFEFCLETGFGSPLKAREREVSAFVQHQTALGFRGFSV